MSALEVSPTQAAAVDRVAQFIVRFGLTVPAILTLESMRPLSTVGSQFMHLLSPAVTTFLMAGEWDELASLLEDRRGLEYILDRIEAIDSEVR